MQVTFGRLFLPSSLTQCRKKQLNDWQLLFLISFIFNLFKNSHELLTGKTPGIEYTQPLLVAGKDNYKADIQGHSAKGLIPYDTKADPNVDEPLNVGFYHKYASISYLAQYSQLMHVVVPWLMVVNKIQLRFPYISIVYGAKTQ